MVTNFEKLMQLKKELIRFMMVYEFGIDELNTKINILKQEFQYIHEYNPIEHVKSRIKSPESIMKKVIRKKYDMNLITIKENIKDIAGIRITCSFISDIYKISDMLGNQSDIKVIETKDYIKKPKPNGYQSLHLILSIPVYMSDRIENVYVEVQIRTIAMDFWASLEHKIFYKYNEHVPKHLLEELKEAADSVASLDKKMEQINMEVEDIKNVNGEIDDVSFFNLNKEMFKAPLALLETLK